MSVSGVCLEKVKWRDGRAPGKERGGRRWARVWRNLELEGVRHRDRGGRTITT